MVKLMREDWVTEYFNGWTVGAVVESAYKYRDKFIAASNRWALLTRTLLRLLRQWAKQYHGLRAVYKSVMVEGSWVTFTGATHHIACCPTVVLTFSIDSTGDKSHGRKGQWRPSDLEGQSPGVRGG